MKLPGPMGQQVALRARPLAPMTEHADAEAAGRGWDTVRRAADQMLDRATTQMRMDNERRAAIQASTAIAQARNDLTQQLLDAQRKAPPGAVGFAGGFAQTVKDYGDKLLADPANSDPQVQGYLKQRLAGLGAELNDHAMNFEATADLAQREANLKGTLNLQANTVRTDGSQYPGALGEMLGAVRASGIPADRLPAAEALARDTLATAYIQGLTQKNPQLAQRELDSGKYDGDLALGRKDELLRANQAQLDRLQAEQDRATPAAQASMRARVETGFQDEIAARSTTGQSLNQISPTLIRGAYPADQYGDVAERKIQQLDLASQGYNARQSIAFTTFPEDQAKIAAAAPQSATGYALQLGNQGALATAVNDKWARLSPTSSKFDPAGYAVDNSPQLRALWQAAANDPSKVRDALEMSDQLQTQLGLAANDHRVLSVAQAKQQAGQITSLPPDQAAATIDRMATAYGDRWPQAFAEMKLPPAYQVLATTDGAGRRVLTTALQTNPKALDDLAGPNAALVKKALPDAMGQFLGTINYRGGPANGGDIAAAWQDAVQKSALQYTGQGMDPNAAVKQAVIDLITNRYDFATGAGYNARVPKGSLAQVESFADSMLGNLRAQDVAVPPSGPVTGQLTADQQRDFYFKNGIQSGAQWVTSPKDDGLMLLDAQRQPVMRSDGSPVSFTFDQAMQAPPVATMPAGAAQGDAAVPDLQTTAAGGMVQ